MQASFTKARRLTPVLTTSSLRRYTWNSALCRPSHSQTPSGMLSQIAMTGIFTSVSLDKMLAPRFRCAGERHTEGLFFSKPSCDQEIVSQAFLCKLRLLCTKSYRILFPDGARR